MKQASLGSSGVILPGSVQEMTGYGTWGHGLVMNMIVVLGWCLDLKILNVFSSLNNSITLWSESIALHSLW